jgi:hypothetical protein
VLPAILLAGPERLFCVTPASFVAGNATVRATLNGGIKGSVSLSSVPFYYYLDPNVTAAEPNVRRQLLEGVPTLNADGGDELLVRGEGFDGLSAFEAALGSLLLVRFGNPVRCCCCFLPVSGQAQNLTCNTPSSLGINKYRVPPCRRSSAQRASSPIAWPSARHTVCAMPAPLPPS